MFSDTAYIDVAAMLSIFLVFIVHRLYSVDRFESISWKAIKRVELKGVAILLLLASLLCGIIYNARIAYVKYSMSFWVDPVTGLIITRPLIKYTNAFQRAYVDSQVWLNLCYTFQCSALFLVMSLWSHMSKALLNQQFMSSFEFKAYMIYSVLVLAIYPFLQMFYFFSGSSITSVIIPLFLYSFQCLLLIVLTQVANWRFRKLVSQLPVNASASSRIIFYSQMNNLLACALFLSFFGLVSITIDSANVFTKIYIAGFTFIYPITIMFLLPPPMKESEQKQPVFETEGPESRPATAFVPYPPQAYSESARSSIYI